MLHVSLAWSLIRITGLVPGRSMHVGGRLLVLLLLLLPNGTLAVPGSNLSTPVPAHLSLQWGQYRSPCGCNCGAAND